MPLFPPLNFGTVETDLYRSGIPNELNFQFLQSLNLKTVLILSPDCVDVKL
jgi:tyrosine-protein phosphatase OCA1